MNTRFSQFAPGTAIQPTDQVVGLQGSNNVRFTGAQIAAIAGGGSGDAISPASYGLIADGGSHPITAADITANVLLWRGTYDLGTEWDTVATQEAIYAAFADPTDPPLTSDTITIYTKLDTLLGAPPEKLVHGNTGTDWGLSFGNTITTAVAGNYIRFGFAMAHTITEATWYQNAADSQGTWQWQGSNSPDVSGGVQTWTNIGSTFTLGGTTTQVQTQLAGNATAYFFYRLLGISGNWNTTTSLRAIRFKQEGAYNTSNRGQNLTWSTLLSPNFNKRLFLPPGQYQINRKLLMIASGFEVDTAGRRTADLQWKGDPWNPVFQTDSVNYGTFSGLSFTVNNRLEYMIWDMNSNNPFGGLKTQQITLYDCFFNGGGNARQGIYVSRRGGGGQGDTVVYINMIMLGLLDAGVILGGANALEHTFIDGDIQACCGDGIRVFGGYVSIYGMHYENQPPDTLNNWPIQNQALVEGADVHLTPGGGDASTISVLNSVRTESDILLYGEGGRLATVETCGASSAQLDWFGSYPRLLGTISTPSANNTKRRSFILVDTGALNKFLPFNAAASTTTLITDPAASYSVNQWTGFALEFRFSNGFVEHHTISSNTATTISLVGDPLSSPPNSLCLYSIVGHGAASAPNFDSLGNGVAFFKGSSGQGFSTTAGSNTIGCSALLAVNQYVVIPSVKIIQQPLPYDQQTQLSQFTALIAKVTAVLGGDNYTVSEPADVTIAFGTGYYGNAILDGQEKWMHLPYSVVRGTRDVNNCSFGNGYLTRTGNINNLDIPASSTWSGEQYYPPGAAPSIGTNPNGINYSAYPDHKAIANDLLSTAAVVDLTTPFNFGDIFLYTPNQNATLNAPIPLLYMSRRIVIHVTTSGTTTFTITFGSNFKSQSTLATGAVDSKVFVLVFESNGKTWNEVSRTSAM